MKKQKFDPYKNLKLDAYEQEIEDSIGRGEWKSVGNIDKLRKRYAHYARYTKELLKKDARVNIRVNATDLHHIRTKAREHGLGYQTLISTILHEYAKGNITVML